MGRQVLANGIFAVVSSATQCGEDIKLRVLSNVLVELAIVEVEMGYVVVKGRSWIQYSRS